MQLASPVHELLNGFRKHLIAKGTSEKQAREKYNRVFRIIQECGFSKWNDITGSHVENFLTDLHKKDGRASRTVNGYLEALKHFCSWIRKEKRAPYSPVEHLCALNVNIDRRHVRRALTIEECRDLLSVTKQQPYIYRISGNERSLLYWVALESGRRANEIKTLTISCCNLSSEPPTLTIKPRYNKKKRKERIQPIPRDLAKVLKEYIGERQDDELLFPNMPDITNLAKILRKDLEAAKIPYRDNENRVVDFHALRHTYATNLARSGVHPKIAMDLLDHSDINLTMAYYSHTDVKERAQALSGLPNLVGT
jgi:integrase